ncbi:MAG: hypothetical protein EA379_07680 [Phycisphaerales bacterium]|nr:MAG: hypothetical protein EA379_07680 [Phycisphaerales bacterium]
MLKFLRKYNKFILVVGGSLLMVVFLVPQALTQSSGATRGPVAARYDGGTLRERDLFNAGSELQMIDALMGPDLRRALLNMEDGSNERLHWLLLVHEAERAGFVGGPSSGVEIVTLLSQQLAQSMAQQLPAEQRDPATIESFASFYAQQIASTRDALLAQRGPEVDRTLSRAMGVIRMSEAYGARARISGPEAVAVAEDFFDAADIDLGVLSAELFLDESPQPTEEAILAHFERYRDVTPGQGERGIGYLQPAAVQVEWLTIDRQRVRRAVEIDRIEARKRWTENRGDYPGEFDVERENVYQALREEATDRVLRDVDQVVRAAILQDVRAFPELGRWRAVPADWRGGVTSFEEIASQVANRIEERIGVRVEPVVQRRNEWLRRTDLGALPGIGASTMRIGPTSVPFESLIFEVREVVGENARVAQVGVAFGPLMGANGNMYYPRFTDARPAGPAESVEQVRDEVVRNIRLKQAYDALEARIDEIRDEVRRIGVREYMQRHPGLQVREGPVTRRSIFESESLSDDEIAYRQAILSAAQKLDPTRQTSEAPLADRVVVVPIPSGFALALVEIKGRQPLTRQQFDRIASRANLLAVSNRAFVPDDEPFSLDRLRKRLNVRETRVFEDEDSGVF